MGLHGNRTPLLEMGYELYVFGPHMCRDVYTCVYIAMYLDIYSVSYRVSLHDCGPHPAALSEVLWLQQCADVFAFST